MDRVNAFSTSDICKANYIGRGCKGKTFRIYDKAEQEEATAIR
jgi:hypothetical protein